MRLARKLNLLLIFGVVVVMGAYAYFETRQAVVLSNADRQRAQQVALAWLGTLEAVWEQEGSARAAALAERANQRASEVMIRLVGLDATTALPRAELSPEQLAALADHTVVRFERQDESGHDRRYFYVALEGQPSPHAAVEFVESLTGQQRYIHMTQRALLAATLAVILTCALIVTIVHSRLVGRPLELLRDKARRVGAGDFSAPLDLKQADEIGDLAHALNVMCQQLVDADRRVASETEARVMALEQLRHTDRLATVGHLAAGVAHELGTPLSVAATRAQLIASTDLPHPQVVANATIIVEQTERMTAIIQQLLGFSRRRSGTVGTTDVRHLVTRTLDLLSAAANKAHVTVDYQPGSTPLLANVDANQLQQVLANLVLNGIQAMRQGGALRVRADTCHTRPPDDRGGGAGAYLCVTVDDTGAGISADSLPHIFEPFFTTKDIGEGTGLGLAVAHGIVAEHGGWIAVDSTVGRGTRFSVFLPPATVRPDAAVA